MRFADVIGQEKAKSSLKAGVDAGRIPHAQFFVGPEGSGSMALALAYVQYIHCSQRTDDSCGECTNCRQFSGMIYPDLRFTYPFAGKDSLSDDFRGKWDQAFKANPYLNLSQWMDILDVKTVNIFIKELKHLAHNMEFQPFADGYKVQFIWHPEFMAGDSNAILKLIEEPPENSLFILVGESTETVLKTIVSRTQIVRVPPIDNNSMRQVLMQKHGLTEAESMRISSICTGNYLLAQELIENKENEYLDTFIEWLRLINKVNRLEMLKHKEQLLKGGKVYQKGFLLYALSIFRAALLYKYANKEPEFSVKEREFIYKLKTVIDHEVVAKAEELISEYIYAIDRNVSARMIFNSLTHDMMAAFVKKRSRTQATKGVE
jgi:DNA polymerase III subunit delta'